MLDLLWEMNPICVTVHVPQAKYFGPRKIDYFWSEFHFSVEVKKKIFSFKKVQVAFKIFDLSIIINLESSIVID